MVVFQDSNGVAIDLTGFVARFEYRLHTISSGFAYSAGDPAVVVQTAVVNADQVGHKGEVTYTWVAADFTTAGDYEGECWVGNGSNRYASVKYAWHARAALSVPAI